MFSACNGEIIVDSERLENKGNYFEPLLNIMKIGEAYDFNSICDVIYTQNYVVLSSDNKLLICSNIKVPFEPKAEQNNLREIIRKRLKTLRSFDNQVLCAEYGSSKLQVNDIENALFYNIGTASFKNVLTNETSVYFRRIQPNEIYATEKVKFKYIYHYSWCPKREYVQWWGHHMLCQWNKIPLNKVNSATKAFDYYSAIKKNPMLVKCLDKGGETQLGLKIQLFVPRTATSFNVLNIMKPMIDGVICAFHTPCNIMVDELSKRLSVNKELFLLTENTCLNEYCYIKPYRNSVKWSPQDNKLDYVFIEPVIVDEDAFSFSGNLFAMTNHM